MSEQKALYQQFVNELELPVFYQPWWLDKVAKGGQWDVVIHQKKNGEISGVLPYFIKSYYGRQVILMPPLTPYLGPWIRYGSPHNYSRHKLEKNVISSLLKQLPKVTLQMFRLHPCMPNTLPFTWQGYDNAVRQTYILSNIKDEDYLLSQMKPGLRNELLKSRNQTVVREMDSFEEFGAFVNESFAVRKMSNPYPMNILKALDAALHSRAQRLILQSFNDNGPTASVYVILDKHTAYYIAGTYNPQNPDRIALSSLIFEAIRKVSSSVNTFDFEGSAIPVVEGLFRSFGGALTPYYRVNKSANLFVKWMAGLKNPDFR